MTLANGVAKGRGCNFEDIPNGRVLTVTCSISSQDGNAYCQYSCFKGYTETASNVYCAGNDRWVPAGKHPSQNKQPCVKDKDLQTTCNFMFFDNGYVLMETCKYQSSSLRTECRYRCHRGFIARAESVMCNGDGEWIPMGDDPGDDTPPCISDGKPTTTGRYTTRLPVSQTPPKTTASGYYDDPDLRMNISPGVFVGAIVGSVLVLALLVFFVFYRAHKKAKARSSEAAGIDEFVRAHHTNPGDQGNTDRQVEAEFQAVVSSMLNSGQLPPPYHSVVPGTSNANSDRTPVHNNDARPTVFCDPSKINLQFDSLPRGASSVQSQNRSLRQTGKIRTNCEQNMEDPPPYSETSDLFDNVPSDRLNQNDPPPAYSESTDLKRTFDMSNGH